MVEAHFPDLILASGSPRRKDLLEEAGYRFGVQPAPVEELESHAEGIEALTAANARLKTEAVAGRYPDAVVLGADTLVSLDGEALGKPRDREHALEMVARLSGRHHEVLTAVCLCGPQVEEFSVRTRVTFLPLDREQLRAYHALIDPLDKAGAYAAQDHGDKIIADVEGSWTNVVGLPMEATREALSRFGIEPAPVEGAQ